MEKVLSPGKGKGEKYQSFLSELEEVPVFFEPWYLDAVCGDDRWDVSLVEAGGAVQAVMPYFRRQGMIEMPPLTQVMGPLLRPVDLKYVSRLSREKKLLNGLIAGLPPVSRFYQAFYPGLSNWLPFYWAGYQQTVRYTYRFEDLSDLGSLWEGMGGQLRNEIKRCQKRGIQIVERDDVDQMIALIDMTFARQGKNYPTAPEVVRRLYRAARENDAAQLFFAVDERGRIHATALLVWNKWCAYYLAGGSDPALRDSGAHKQLLWALVKFAQSRSRIFDFEGSMIERVESVFRNFGARQTPIFAVWKDERGWVRTCREESRNYLLAVRGRIVRTIRGR